jgi:hypothetical protein
MNAFDASEWKRSLVAGRKAVFPTGQQLFTGTDLLMLLLIFKVVACRQQQAVAVSGGCSLRLSLLAAVTGFS